MQHIFKVLMLSLGLAIATPAVWAAGASKPGQTELTADFIYKYLVGEIAGQRGDLALAGAALLDLATTSRDARLAERATKAAIHGNQPQMALRAGALWVELDPASTEARQAMVQMLLAVGKISELRPHLQKLLAVEENRAGAFMSLVGLLSRSKDKAAVLKLMQELAKLHADLPEARFAVAHAAWNNGQDRLALSELRAADQLNPGWEPAAMLYAQILQRNSVAEALQFYHEFLERYPDSNETRLAYARLLVNEKRFESAKQQFDKLVQAAPDNPDIHVIVGLLAIQMEDLDSAKQHLLKALDLGYKDPDQITLYLGQIAEQQQDDTQAKAWYAQIGPDSAQYLGAQLRLASILARQGKLDDALALVRAIPDLSNEQLVLARQTEASLLMQAKRPQDAFELLRQTVETLPNTPELLYDYAMAAERVGQYDVMEKQLRILIQLKPDMGHAYNALGYSLADRNERLDEALALIEKALSLNPNDYFILDSMGWVQYRRGHYKEALEYLRRAYAIQADPEIAAHLGEVLWVMGQREEALKTWEEALRQHPDNELLRNTSKKYQ
ncbi:MAG: tetratricopeptide repeat protein [Methylophilaceae bacterium]|nr:tetratricopeptide repeat protein [Methylophilaceae bacterium]